MYNKHEIMRNAWNIRRSTGFSMSVALRMAWELAKGHHEETKSYTWTTPRGAKIETVVTVEHITRELVDADGYKIVANCNDWVRRVDRMTVNGKTTEMKELWNEKGQSCIMIGKRGRDRILVVLPDDVDVSIYGAQREEIKQAAAKAFAAEKMYNDHYNMVVNAMNM